MKNLPSPGHNWPAILMCLLALACRPSAPIHPVLEAWLTCVECIDGELDSVRALAAREPATIDALRDALILGPTAHDRATIAVYLGAEYDQLTTRIDSAAPGSALPYARDAFVEHYAGNMVVTYRSRAARALGVIGGQKARVALDLALRLPADSLPPSVEWQVRHARDSVLLP